MLQGLMDRETQTYRYCVDADDLLIEVDELWLAFARENGAPQLSAASVIGRSLWDFVEGEAIRAVYEDIHQRLRSSGKSAAFSFRCDSPRLKRHMSMSISPAENGQLVYASHILWTEPQREVLLLDADRQRTKSFLSICSCCKKAMLEPEVWLEIEKVSLSAGLLESGKVPQLRHTICPDCSHALTKSVGSGEVA
jgi:hypothetical protein